MMMILMMISKEQFFGSKKYYLKKITDGAVFIYPTDTIYGIGCDATNDAAVRRIREAKKRSDSPFSVAVPSKSWIKENCILSAEAKKWLDKLPGPYTLLLKLKNKNAAASSVNPKTDVLGIRMPDNWFSKVIAELNLPIVSTSANVTAKKHMTSLNDLDREVAAKVDFIIYEGKKASSPSTIVKLYGRKAEIIRR